MRTRTAILALAALALLTGPADAKDKKTQCKDANNHFTACQAATTPAAAPAKTAAPPSTPAPAMKAAPAVAMKPASGSTMTSTKTAAPAASGAKPAGATAQCKDGSYSMSKHRSGTCSSHGGVGTWL